MRHHLLPFLAALALLAPSVGLAQTPPEATTAPPTKPQAVTDYLVGPQDVLGITVFNGAVSEPTLSGRFTVESDGSINYPLIGRVPVAGKTLRAIQDDMTTLLAAGYLVNPQVAILVEQYRSQSIFVVGEVRAAGRQALHLGHHDAARSALASRRHHDHGRHGGHRTAAEESEGVGGARRSG